MLAVGRVIERYTVEAELGAGGVATVYRVRHNQLGSRHALKVLQLHGQKIRERLIEEGQAQARLKHPNIVSVTDVIDVDGAPGLIMEYVEGLSLDRWLRLHSPTLPQAEALFRGILAGVARAHRDGLVHRDLKPGNVLIDATEDGLVPKVADFGLAKALIEDTVGRAETRSGIAMGTPAYMAPEQVRDAKNVDQRADIFALGCILYELCCGASPFEAGDVLTIFSRLAAGSYTPPEVVNPEIPPRLRAAIVGCLANRREERIPDCASLRAILDGAAYTPPPGAFPAWVPPDEPTATGYPARPVSTPTFPADSITARAPSPSGSAETIALSRVEPPPVAPTTPPARPAPASSLPGGAPRTKSGGMGIALAGAGLLTLLVAAGVAGVGWWWWAGRDPTAATGAASPSPTVTTSTPAASPDPAAAPPTGTTSPDASATETPATATTATAAPSGATTATAAPAAAAPPTAATSPGSTPTATSTGSASTGSASTSPTSAGGTAATGATSTAATSPAATATRAGATGTVSVSGDAEAVWLEGDAGRVEPGAVPEGAYRIKATFSGAIVGAGTVTVRAGQAVTLVCSSEFQRCKAR